MLDGRALAERHADALLGRAPLGSPPSESARAYRGGRVVITGAGGSVGRHLAAAIAAAEPAALVLVDHHEASLWDLHRHFEGRAELVLADIRNTARLGALLRRVEPTVIFHLAAYKHVPFGEVFAAEVFGVNVLGTRALLAQAAELGVERFVYPSSDKACGPPSLYGATKRLAELAVRAAARAGRRYNIARFVNILGTQGSVVETFAQQVATGGPLTVTDRRMTRFWISMDEALWLLLSTAELETGGQTLMLDAREEITVVEMARRICSLLRGSPDACRLEFGTPRPGERLREALLAASERFEPGPAPGLLRVVSSRAEQHQAALPDLLARLDALAEAEPERLREACMDAARALQ